MPYAAEQTVALQLAEVSVYANGQAILDGVSLSIRTGERVALIGPSGSGKTTLLRLLGASLWAGDGEVRTLGADPSRLRGRELRKHRKQVGFLRQRDNLVQPLRVAHNVQMGRLGEWSTLHSLLQLIWPRDLGRAREALQRVELEDRLWSLPEELSGGEQQRVAVARLMVQKPSVILADEPVSALDIRLGARVIELLMELAGEREATLLISLHSLDLLRRGFDRVLALSEGRLVWDGSPGDLDQATLREVYGAEYHALGLAGPIQE